MEEDDLEAGDEEDDDEDEDPVLLGIAGLPVLSPELVDPALPVATFVI